MAKTNRNQYKNTRKVSLKPYNRCVDKFRYSEAI